MPLDYILPELLKNAARATIENNPNLRGASLPPVSIVLASNSQVADHSLGWANLSNVVRTSLSGSLTGAVESPTTR